MNSGNQPPPELLTADQVREVEAQVVEPDKKAQQELVELEHAHAQITQKTELGWIGCILGSRQEKPGNVAFLVILFCFALLFFAYVQVSGATPTKDSAPGGLSEPFFKLTSVLIGVIGLALGYLFGSNNKN